MVGTVGLPYVGGMISLPRSPRSWLDTAARVLPRAAARSGYSPLRPALALPLPRANRVDSSLSAQIMNTKRMVPLLSAVLGVAAFTAAGCAPKKDPGAGIVMPPAPTSAPAVMAPELPAPKASATGGTAAVAVSWPDLEALTFERRSEFMAGLKQMEATVDRQLAELGARRAAMSDTVATRDWDFAMKEMKDARTYLRSMGDEAASASAQTWQQQKAKVGQAWVRTQAAYEKVKLSTTS